MRAGADVTAADDHGVTPLERAAENASLAMVEKLLAAGGDPNATQTSGLTPLMTAARTGDAQVVGALLRAGADVTAATIETQSTALMWAVSEGHADVVRAVARARVRAPRTSTAKPGSRPLMYAARNGDIPLVGGAAHRGGRRERSQRRRDACAAVCDCQWPGSVCLVSARAGRRPEWRDGGRRARRCMRPPATSARGWATGTGGTARGDAISGGPAETGAASTLTRRLPAGPGAP